MASFILLLTILSTVPCAGSYYMSSEASKWSNMEEKCKPAAPDVQVDYVYPPAVYNVNNLDEERNEDLWVGYYQVERAFEYIGCVQKGQLFSNEPTFIPINGDPGHCFPGCGERTVIGVTKTRCYCFEDDYSLTNYSESGCKEVCANPLVACGKDELQNEKSYISLYKINPTVDVTSINYSETQQLSEEKKCLLVSTNILNRFYWDGCLKKKGVMCSDDENVGGTNVSWINAANACFQNGGYPSLYSNSKGVTRSNVIPFWTGVFKTNVVYSYNAYISVKRRNDQKKFGYLTQRSKKLRFADADSLKKVLCSEFHGPEVTVTQSNYLMSSGASQWTNMEDECKPATPNVQVDFVYPPAVYNVNNLDKERNESLWVGYYQVERAFEYIGCVQQRQLFSNDPPSIKIKGDPGHCFPGCGESTIIGVTKTRCYCLEDKYSQTNYTESGCKEMCTHPLVACGKDELPYMYSYLSIYKINPTVDVASIHSTETLQLEEEKKCLLISTNIPKRFYWDGCLLKTGVMCSYDGRVENVGCTNVSEYCSWINASNACFKSGGFPALYSNSEGVNSSGFIPFWTGVFKTSVVYSYNAYTPVERRLDQKKFGYLEQNSNKLRFAEADSMKKVLCEPEQDSDLSKLLQTLMIFVLPLLLLCVMACCIVANGCFKLAERARNRLRRQLAERTENRQRWQLAERAEHDAVGGASKTINPTNKETHVSYDEVGGASKTKNPTNKDTPVSYNAVGGASKTINPTNKETPVSNDAVGGASKSMQDHDTKRNEEKHGYGASANEPLEDDRIDTYHSNSLEVKQIEINDGETCGEI